MKLGPCLTCTPRIDFWHSQFWILALWSKDDRLLLADNAVLERLTGVDHGRLVSGSLLLDSRLPG